MSCPRSITSNVFRSSGPDSAVGFVKSSVNWLPFVILTNDTLDEPGVPPLSPEDTKAARYSFVAVLGIRNAIPASEDASRRLREKYTDPVRCKAAYIDVFR